MKKNKVADSSDEFGYRSVLLANLYPTNPLPVRLKYPTSYLNGTAGQASITDYR